MRRRLAGLLVVPLVLVLAGCSSSDSDPGPAASPGVAPGVAPSSELPTWTPCDDLAAAEVGRLLGEEVTEEVGTPGARRCAFLPTTDGGATLDVNYLWFDGSFDQAWDSIGEDVAGVERDLDLPGADAARLVVQQREDAVLVTGFVQTGGLIESVNAVSLDPSDRGRLVRAARGVLALLSSRAPERAG